MIYFIKVGAFKKTFVITEKEHIYIQYSFDIISMGEHKKNRFHPFEFQS